MEQSETELRETGRSKYRGGQAVQTQVSQTHRLSEEDLRFTYVTEQD